MTRYSTILLDADETLLDFPRSEKEALFDALRESGIQPTDEMARTYSEINLAVWKKLERGEITKSELRISRFSDFCNYCGLPVQPQHLSDAYVAALATKSYLLEGADEVCRALAAHCRLYIITNGIASVQRGRWSISPIRHLFNDFFISDEIGAEKPSRAFFDAVIARIENFDPRDTLVVGDSLTSDMKGGIAAGLDTCWYNPKGVAIPDDLPITYTIHSLEDLVPLVLGA